MRQVWRWATTVTGTMAMIVGMGLTQALPSFGTASELYGAGSLKELITLRDRLIQELETPPKNQPEPNFLTLYLLILLNLNPMKFYYKS
jgi:hypothetical protein